MPKRFKQALCWIRRDLRLNDQRALAAATDSAESVAMVFVFDTLILNALADRDDRRLTFIHRCLTELDRKLRERGSALIVLHGDPKDEIPRLAQALSAEAVFTARDYEPYARSRDKEVSRRLYQLNIGLHSVKDSVIFEQGEVLNQSDAPFRTYTPYARAWRNQFVLARDASEAEAELECLSPLSTLKDWLTEWPLEKLGFEPADLWIEPGENAGLARLDEFADRIGQYAHDRDYPAIDGVSALSAYLRFGAVGIRQCVRMAVEHGEAGEKWLSELIWRDFYQDILANHPNVVEEPFQPQYKDLDYPGSEEGWEAWCKGETGYPIVDAAMRCFNATGWMHDRLRMIVASFLTKDLLVDYRKGEAYFARYLLDFDLASNNGGWQWAASVGCDAQPYFRIFNPILQSKKFDPDGKFIRQWLPELAALDNEAIHWPHNLPAFDLLAQGIELGNTYPHPVVDHATQRDLAIKLLSTVSKKG
ncbi:MAG: hypothetical protein BGO01_18610 [Armatimonadetes bacterium 55-13]|nr:deoxyribodipyrimidine photo-lyase [Armatimonadota bacterium]OJU64143.1 MAG: hypothetical protein BGO01_18610 [Armatimonadetes bacterium 55-13]